MGDLPVVPETEFADRRRRLAEAGTDRGWDGVLVAGRSCGTLDAHRNVHWLTGHSFAGVVTTPTGPWSALGHDFVVIDGDGSGTLVSAGTTREPHVEEVRTNQDVESELVAALRDRGLTRGRFGLAGSEVLPWTVGRRLAREFPELELEPADLTIAKARLRLSPIDCEMLRHAADVGQRVLEATLAAAVPGATEGDMAAAGLAEAARTPGTQHWDFAMASGDDSFVYCSSSLPMWDAVTPLRAGDLVHPDCYGYVNGYVYDIQRTKVVGSSPTPAQRVLIEGATEHARRLGEALYDGITPREVHTRGMELMKEMGHELPDRPDSWFASVPHFGHAFSSGFDWPWLGPETLDCDEPLRGPMALTVELPWERDGVGAAFIEDEYLITESGSECISDWLVVELDDEKEADE